MSDDLMLALVASALAFLGGMWLGSHLEWRMLMRGGWIRPIDCRCAPAKETPRG
jgi:hypothetical protein